MHLDRDASGPLWAARVRFLEPEAREMPSDRLALP